MKFLARLFGVQVKNDRPGKIEPIEIIGYGETEEEAIDNVGNAFTANLEANRPDQIAIIGKGIRNINK